MVDPRCKYLKDWILTVKVRMVDTSSKGLNG